MYARLNSFGIHGLAGFDVTAEADISGGLPALNIVGLPDSAVKESGDRVRAALKNLGFKWPDSLCWPVLTGWLWVMPKALSTSCGPGR